MPYWSVHETLGVDAHNAPLKMRTRRIHLSRAGAWSCGRYHPAACAALGSTDVEGSDPPVRGPGAGSDAGVFSHRGLRPPGVAPGSGIPCGKASRAADSGGSSGRSGLRDLTLANQAAGRIIHEPVLVPEPVQALMVASSWVRAASAAPSASGQP